MKAQHETDLKVIRFLVFIIPKQRKHFGKNNFLSTFTFLSEPALYVKVTDLYL